jgi:hypothetical protein
MTPPTGCQDPAHRRASAESVLVPEGALYRCPDCRRRFLAAALPAARGCAPRATATAQPACGAQLGLFLVPA